MTKWTIVGVLTAAMLASQAGTAAAQGAAEPKMFASLEVGAQPTQRTVTSTGSFAVYDETATVNTSQPVHNGPVFGGSVGYRLTPAVGISAGVTVFNARTADATVSASIPDLLVYGQPASVTATTTGLAHSQLGIHLDAVWFHPVSRKLELVLSGGPSVVRVSHDVVSASVTTGTQALKTGTATETGSAFGFNAGGEGNYRIGQKALVGIFVRYVAATTDLPSVTDLKVGGLQAGLGLRLRF